MAVTMDLFRVMVRVRDAQAKIKSKYMHKLRWCARPRLGDAPSTQIMIFACSLLHNKIKYQRMLLLEPRPTLIFLLVA